MSTLIPHRFFSRSMFGRDPWFDQDIFTDLSGLDVFDPFDELDRLLTQNINWIDVPEILSESITPQRAPKPTKVPNKFRIHVNCKGYNPDSVKTKIEGNKLIVSGREGERPSGEEDYTMREFKRSYDLPENADTEKLASFLTAKGKLVVEIPLKKVEEKVEEHKEEQFREDLEPRVLTREDKQVMEMNVLLPGEVDPSRLSVTLKDKDLIIRIETKKEKEEGSEIFYYRRITLPDQTNLQELKCHLEKNKLFISAPMQVTQEEKGRQIPIEQKSTQEQAKTR